MSCLIYVTKHNKKNRTETRSAVQVRCGVDLVHRIGYFNGCVKFKFNERHHCKRKMILYGDDLLV